jgi:PAS domain S-box-containing protein
MKGLDIYLSNLTDEEYEKAKHKVKPNSIKAMPLLSWDVYSEQIHTQNAEAKKDAELNQIISMSESYKWKNDFNSLFNNNDFTALVITDINQKIIWVNEGFTSMTGYSKKFALNKSPKFLQGKETSTKTKQRIKQKIKEDKPFKEIILNYKKDKTLYKCEVKIIPLFNDKTTHFLAFEREII